MKKITLRLASIGLFVGALLFSFSSDSSGRIHAFKKANASGLTYSYYVFSCSGGGVQYICGPGQYPYCNPIPCPQP